MKGIEGKNNEFFDGLKWICKKLGKKKRDFENAFDIFRKTYNLNEIVSEKKKKQPFRHNRKTLFLVVDSGQAVRNFVLSRFFDLVKDKFNLVVLTPFAQIKLFSETHESEGVHVIYWPILPDYGINQVIRFHHYLTSPSSLHKHIVNKCFESKLIGYPALAVANYFQFPGGFEILRVIEKLMLRLIVPNRPFKLLVDFYGPSLLINTMAHSNTARITSWLARRYGLTVLTHVISWDNITTKGALDESADYFALWSNTMVEEMNRFFPRLKAQKHIVGSPQFDAYWDVRFQKKRKEFLKKIGLDTEKPYVLYTTNTPLAMPDEPRIVGDIWRQLLNSTLSGNVGMIVRLHPKDDVQRYEKLLNSNPAPVITTAGEVTSGHGDKWIPFSKDIELLVNSLKHSAVLINVASTMSLESFCFDIPVINIGFNSAKCVSEFPFDFEYYHQSDHYRELVRTGAVSLAAKSEDVIDYIELYLNDPSTNSNSRRQVAVFKIGPLDGKCSERFFSLICRIVGTE